MSFVFELSFRFDFESYLNLRVTELECHLDNCKIVLLSLNIAKEGRTV